MNNKFIKVLQKNKNYKKKMKIILFLKNVFNKDILGNKFTNEKKFFNPI